MGTHRGIQSTSTKDKHLMFSDTSVLDLELDYT